MSEERRRSGRLISNPWLFNWPKKPPVYIDLCPSVDSPLNLVDGSNGRTKMRNRKTVEKAFSSDEDDDFVTPAETFGKSNKFVGKKYSTEKKRQKLSREFAVIENECTAIVEFGGISKNVSNMRIMSMENDATQERRLSAKYQNESPLKRKQARSWNKKNKISTKAGPSKGKLALKNKRMTVGKGEKDGTSRSRTKKKAVRLYHRYIQKKFSPSIMSDVILNLSKSQIEWVRSTGFGALLNFRMVCYTHNLGYNIVEAFNAADCSVMLQAGTIKITENIVHSVMGLPNGNEVVECKKDRSTYSEWAEQFPGCASSEITPSMVRNKILENPMADEHFKWNFLIMMYNFFIESNQNSFLTRDVLGFSGNIETCDKYNWCRLLIEKLKKTHVYWVEDTKRNFAGPLPFLIYLYVSKVKSKGTTFIQANYPTYRGWSNMLLRERQKYDSKCKSFGEGEIVKFRDVIVNGVLEIKGEEEEETLQENDDGTELTMVDIVIREEKHNKNGSNVKNDSAMSQDMDGEENLDEYEVNAFMEQDKVICNDKNILDDSNKLVIVSAGEEIDAKFINKRIMGAVQIEEMDINLLHEVDMHTPTLIHEESTEAEAHKDAVNSFGEGASFEEKPAIRKPRKDAEICGDGFNVVQNTQSHVDVEIDKHFDENTYMISFEKNLKEFEDVYGRCLNNFEVTLALYPQNPRLAKLKSEYSQYFKLFEAASPIAKNLLFGNVAGNAEKKSVVVDEDDFIPNYSLGLSQLIPKNLCSDLDETSNAQMESCSRLLSIPGKRQLVHNKFIKERDVYGNVGEKGQTTAEMERPRREIKASSLCRSPYVSRVVDVGSHVLTTEERNVWQWLFQNRKNKKGNLFEWNDRMCTKAHFQSLQENKKVMSTLIDTWTYLLNENELLKADSSPLRLFMNTETTYGPLQIEVGEDEFEKMNRYAPFDDNMDNVMNMVNEMHNKQYEVKDFDMFVFPIYDLGHYYIICYNMKKTRLEIIDNRVQTAGVEEIYGDLPARLHDCFCHWISIYNLPKESEILNLKPRVHRMGWQTEMNSVDCGIFVMRHMETYMGNLCAWKVGLRIEKDNQQTLLNKLRIIYCHKILTWRGNSKRTLILEGAANLAKGKNLVT